MPYKRYTAFLHIAQKFNVNKSIRYNKDIYVYVVYLAKLHMQQENA